MSELTRVYIKHLAYENLLDHIEELLEELLSDEYDSEIVKNVNDNVISWIKLLKEIKTAKK